MISEFLRKDYDNLILIINSVLLNEEITMKTCILKKILYIKKRKYFFYSTLNAFLISLNLFLLGTINGLIPLRNNSRYYSIISNR